LVPDSHRHACRIRRFPESTSSEGVPSDCEGTEFVAALPTQALRRCFVI
jgi:hypothetical protein